jgi:hypothetical protein
MAFDASQLALIERMAEGLSKREVLDYWSLDYDDLDKEDQDIFDTAFKRGTVNIKMYALQNLKQAMQQSRTGMQASLAALTQFGEQWTVADQVSKVKSFKVTLD